LAGAVSVEVEVELAVSEPVADPVSPPQRECGLANARRPADRGDHDGTRGVCRALQLFGEDVEFSGASDEVGDCGGQLTGRWPFPAGRPGRGVGLPQLLVFRASRVMEGAVHLGPLGTPVFLVATASADDLDNGVQTGEMFAA
jgi:hypothetical protein